MKKIIFMIMILIPPYTYSIDWNEPTWIEDAKSVEGRQCFSIDPGTAWIAAKRRPCDMCYQQVIYNPDGGRAGCVGESQHCWSEDWWQQGGENINQLVTHCKEACNKIGKECVEAACSQRRGACLCK